MEQWKKDARREPIITTMDAGYKTSWIVKKTFDDGRVCCFKPIA